MQTEYFEFNDVVMLRSLTDNKETGFDNIPGELWKNNGRQIKELFIQNDFRNIVERNVAK